MERRRRGLWQLHLGPATRFFAYPFYGPSLRQQQNERQFGLWRQHGTVPEKRSECALLILLTIFVSKVLSKKTVYFCDPWRKIECLFALGRMSVLEFGSERNIVYSFDLQMMND
jgi:hypothetical protein